MYNVCVVPVRGVRANYIILDVHSHNIICMLYCRSYEITGLLRGSGVDPPLHIAVYLRAEK